MANTVKNYIFFYGGSFGDLVTTIVNNGKICEKHDWLRENKEKITIDSKLLNSTGLETICGHNKKILDLGLKNFLITLEDTEILDIAADRLFIINNHNAQQRFDILKQYFPMPLWSAIHNLNLEAQIKIIKKKYKNQYNDDVDATPIDCSCIFNREQLLNTLDKHFEFDHDVARSLWNNWFQKQARLGFIPNK